MAQHVQLGVPPGHQLAVKPDDAVAVVEWDYGHRSFHPQNLAPGPSPRGLMIVAQNRPAPVRIAVKIVLKGEAVGKRRSEEHTSELQSIMRSSYAVFCLQKKTITQHHLYTATNNKQ